MVPPMSILNPMATTAHGTAEAPALLSDEDALFRDIVSRLTDLPDGVKRVTYRLDDDFAGDPAVYIIIVAEDDLKPSRQKLESLRRLSNQAREAVTRSDTHRWPYIRIEPE